MIEDIIRDADQRMNKAVEALKQEFARLRTGRAHPSLLEHVRVEYYGTRRPVTQVANVSVLDAQTLSVSPWDRNMVGPVEKAIRSSDLGLNPVVAGAVIRISLPPLTEERRRELTRVARHEAEEARVAIRNVRRDAMHMLKELVKDKVVSEDEERRAEEKLQKVTDQHIATVDEQLARKEKEMLEL